MTKKLMSALIALAMVFTVIAVIPAGTAFAADTQVVDFEGEAAGSPYTAFGFTKKVYPSSDSDSTITAFVKSMTIEKDGNANNKALAVLQNNTYMYLTADEMTEIESDGSNVNLGTSTYKAVKKRFGENYYYIGYNTGNAGAAKWRKYWIKCDANGNITDATSSISSTSNNNYFDADGAPRESRAGNSTEIHFPKPISLKTSGGKLIGTYSIKFDFTQPDLGIGFVNLVDTISFKVSCGSPFYMDDDEFRVDEVGNAAKGYTSFIKTADDESTRVVTQNANKYLGKTRDAKGIVNSVANLDTITPRNEGEWHTMEVEFDFDNAVYRIYYADKPLYYKVSDTCYSSEFVIYGYDTMTTCPDVSLFVPRDRAIGNHAPIIDDITYTYDTDTIETKLTWATISNGQSQAAVISNLNLVDSITVKGVDYPVTWSSSNPNVISDKGVVVRGDENTSAVLTATVGGKTLTFSVGVAGKSGKKQVFLAGDSHMCYYDESWYPQKGWGQYIDDYFTNTDFYNVADGGESTKSFYEGAGFFKDGILDKLSQGDYVLISFGTNDSNTGYSTAVTLDEYATYLQKYVDDITAKNVVPVFITSPVSGGGVSTASTGINAYVDKMKQIANQNGIACIDLRTKHISYINKIRTYAGGTGTEIPELVMDEMYTYQIDQNYDIDYTKHPSGALSDDGTDIFHFSERGAKVLARWVATEIYKSSHADLKVLAESMKAYMVKPTIYTAGDSLMYDWTRTAKAYGYNGWGEYIDQYFDGAKVANHALSGASTNTFFNSVELFPSFRYNMYDDDYLIISLGFNDAGHAGTPHPNRNGENTDPNAAHDGKTFRDAAGNYHIIGANLTDYKANLKKFVNAAKERGVTPILVTFPNDGTVYNNKQTYVQTIRDVAEEEDVPLIDLRKKHLAYIAEFYGGSVENNAWINKDDNGWAAIHEMHTTLEGLKSVGVTEEQLADFDGSVPPGFATPADDKTHFNTYGAQKLAKWFIVALMESKDSDLAALQSLVDEDAIPSEDVAASNLKITGVEFDATPDTNGRTGAAIRATLPEGRLSRMKWVFATDEHRYYSSTIVPETTGVKVSGDVEFGIIFNNGTVDENGVLNGEKKINSVDAIFMIDGMEFFTNLLDKAAKN